MLLAAVCASWLLSAIDSSCLFFSLSVLTLLRLLQPPCCCGSGLESRVLLALCSQYVFLSAAGQAGLFCSGRFINFGG